MTVLLRVTFSGGMGKLPKINFQDQWALYRYMWKIHNICLKLTKYALTQALLIGHKPLREFSTYSSIFIHSCQLSSSNPDFVGMNSKAKKIMPKHWFIHWELCDHNDSFLAEVLFTKIAHFKKEERVPYIMIHFYWAFRGLILFCAVLYLVYPAAIL